jgi:hypothetical protein
VGVGVVVDARDVGTSGDDAFGEEKSGGELEVPPRRAHRYRYSPPLAARADDPNLHRLLGGEQVSAGLYPAVLDHLHADPRARAWAKVGHVSVGLTTALGPLLPPDAVIVRRLDHSAG